MLPTWFLYLNGFALVTLGVALLITRPAPRGASFTERFFGLRTFWGTLWAALCCAVGIGLLALALGYLRWPAQDTAQPPSRSPSPFRTRR